jgi:inner membrane protein
VSNILLAKVFYKYRYPYSYVDDDFTPLSGDCAGIGFRVGSKYKQPMASAISHAFAAVALGKVYTGRKMSWRFWSLAVASAVLPDADVVAFSFGIPYGSMFGHRGITHSLPFALCWAFLVVWCEFKHVVRFSRAWWGLLAFFFVVTASHGLLDALTNGGRGVAFFAPFSARRYFFPWHGIEVSPISIKQFLTEWGGAVLRSEAKYIWLPGALLWLAAWIFRKFFRRRSTSPSS